MLFLKSSVLLALWNANGHTDLLIPPRRLLHISGVATYKACEQPAAEHILTTERLCCAECRTRNALEKLSLYYSKNPCCIWKYLRWNSCFLQIHSMLTFFRIQFSFQQAQSLFCSNPPFYSYNSIRQVRLGDSIWPAPDYLSELHLRVGFFELRHTDYYSTLMVCWAFKVSASNKQKYFF